MKTLPALQSFKLISKRIEKVAALAPAAKLKGIGHARHELRLDCVFRRLQKLAPAHCEVVTSREAVNGFGKLGFVGRNYVSPELHAVIEANAEDFVKLNTAMRMVEDVNL